MEDVKNYEELMDLVSDEDIKVINLKFSDLLGSWQHISIPVNRLNESFFKEGNDGFHFDLHQYKGWGYSDTKTMVLKPNEKTAFIDPFSDTKTLVLICDIFNPIEDTYFDGDPRFIAKKAETYLKSVGAGDGACFGPESSFFIFDHIRYDQSSLEGYYQVGSSFSNKSVSQSSESSDGDSSNSLVINNNLNDIRNDMMLKLKSVSVDVESQQQGIDLTGQSKIDVKYNRLLPIADDLMKVKYTVKQVANNHHKTVTFMPKPLLNEKGAGLSVHFSIWNKDHNVFHGPKQYGLSPIALNAVGGILEHLPAIMAFTNPTTNSYKRISEKNEPNVIAYAQNQSQVAVRIPGHHGSEESARIILQFPDPSCNGYLAFSAILMAAIDGIQTRISAGDEYIEGVPFLNKRLAPAMLEDSLNALASDKEFLMKGDVFTEELIDSYIDYKMTNEVNAIHSRPHPWEFSMYYDL